VKPAGNPADAGYPKTPRAQLRDPRGRLTGDKPITLLGGDKRKQEEGGILTGGVATNGYLWRAAMDVVGFMPLISTDAIGGVILTDWYTDPAVQTAVPERMKCSVILRSTTLQADAVQVRAFRQQWQRGTWVDAPVSPKVSSALEEKILAKARDLRLAAQAAPAE
jgi:hypothetical protein